jgi:all-trans-retinol 13,14-reductase
MKEIYGLDHSPSHRQSKPKHQIKHFYLTGQDIVTAGVGGHVLRRIVYYGNYGEKCTEKN